MFPYVVSPHFCKTNKSGLEQDRHWIISVNIRNSLEINFAHLGCSVSNVAHETEQWGKGSGVVCKGDVPKLKSKAWFFSPAKQMWFSARTAVWAYQTPLSLHLFTKWLGKMRFFFLENKLSRAAWVTQHPSGQGSAGRVPLAALAQDLLNHQPIGTAYLIMLEGSCNRIPRQLSHCYGLGVSWLHVTFGVLREDEPLFSLFFSPKMCRSP